MRPSLLFGRFLLWLWRRQAAAPPRNLRNSAPPRGCAKGNTMPVPEADDARECALIGPCCGCGERRPLVTIVILPFKSPTPGIGWSCITCGLRPDGAIAVLCANCDYQPGVNIKWACKAEPSNPERVLMEHIRGRHAHDLSLHLAATEQTGVHQ